jgi:2-polyprenyl-3-methyl-5-hydroxy-6-metoxy-1,4-benzoquinol methylase
VKTTVDDMLVGREQQIVQSPKSAIKSFVKLVAPTPVLHFASRTRSLLDQKIRRPYKVKQWKRELNAAQRSKSSTRGEFLDLRNTLPNSGGITIDTQTLDPKKIIETGYRYVDKRGSGVAGFEGLALDDALGWLEEYRHYSFVPLAKAVSEIARSHLGTTCFTTLELGCGWGGLRVLLQAFGSTFYLGIDANPLPFSHSPFMLEAPSSYRLLNLQEKIDFGMKFNIVCSFEVLEHMREDHLDNILETISAHVSVGSLFIGTAAFTDYTDVHVTVHPRGWWLNRFQQHRLVPVCLAKETRWLKLLASRHPFNWNASTTSIFVLHKI